MSDVFWLEIVKDSFLLILFTITICTFKEQIRGALDALGSFKIAGASFTFGNKRATEESYILLAEILVDSLSININVEHLCKALTLPQIEKIGQFAKRYTDLVPKENWNEELLRNIGYLLHLGGRFEQSIELFEQLLKKRPDSYDFLDNKGYALLISGISANVEQAKNIFTKLTIQHPTHPRNYLRLASSLSQLDRHGEAIESIKKMIEHDLKNEFPLNTSERALYKTRIAFPDEFMRLEESSRNRNVCAQS